ncbi:mitochondrial protein Pet127-domain-containing protein [Xylariomycetidae sp. FL0641]|nr:mitochondrial protein Pet127-domain-containing protein [Xylariomycetidae sp. FL0641]
MLQLGRRTFSRVGASYVCASCLTSPRNLHIARRAAVLPGHHGRALSTTANRPADAASEPQTEAPVEPPSNPPATKKQSAPKKKKQKKEAKKAAKSGSANDGSDPQRQLHVLQGALEALKNVLNEQNIDVSQIAKLKGVPGIAPTAESDAKSEPAAKAAKSKTTQDPALAKALRKAAKKGSQKKTKAAKKTKQAKSGSSGSKDTDPAAETQPETQEGVEPTPFSGALRHAPAPPLRKRKPGDPVPFSGAAPPNYRPNIQIPAAKAQTPKKAEKEAKTTKPRWPPVISTLNADQLYMKPIKTDRPPVPSLSYGLERVLFNEGVYRLQDPRSRVYNFDPYLAKIMPIQEFDFNALKQYITSSKDETLIGIAKEHGKRYTGSTSSMTSMLSHFHYLLSSWREINDRMLSKKFVPDSNRFTRIMTAPSAVFLHWKDGTYAIDADKEYDTANILSMLGKSMEKLLTLSREDFEKYRHENSDQLTEEERNADEAYHYTGLRDFMMRSQLDAYDPRIPGSGMFDLKTRAVISIRMDARGFHKGLGYEIRKRQGQWESFEREYYDMIRSAFLKYSLQVRMGRMDGIFVAFHNTQRIFGFQYIPLTEMDQALHGPSGTTIGNKEFKLSLGLLNDLMNRATKMFPESSLRMHFETRPSASGPPYMYVFAKPVTPGEIEAVQNSQKKSIEAFERNILGLVKEAADADEEAESEAAAKELEDSQEEDHEDSNEATAQDMSSFEAWEDAVQMVEDAMNDDEQGIGMVREAIEDALEQSGLLDVKSPIEAQEYVNALLGALTGYDPATFDASSPTNVQAEEGVDEHDIESGADSSMSSPEVEQEPASTEQKEERLEEQDDGTSSTQNDSPDTATTTGEDATHDDSSRPLEPATAAEDEPAQTESIEETAQEKDQDSDNSEMQSQTEATTPQTTETEVVSPSRGPEEEIEDEEDEEENEEEDEYDDDDDVDAHAESSSSSMSPLKELIVRMAKRLDKEARSQDSVQSELDDSSKLKAFERILGRLISQSKGDQPQQEYPIETSTETSAGPDTESLDAETPAETEPASPFQKEGPESSEPELEPEEGELLGMVLTVKNKVNGSYVARPEGLNPKDDWAVEYNIERMPDERARTIYAQLKGRRRKVMEDTGDRETEWYNMFKGKLSSTTQKGRDFRAKETAIEKTQPVHVVGRESQSYEEVFGKPDEPVSKPVSEPESELNLVDEDSNPESFEASDAEAESEEDEGRS